MDAKVGHHFRFPIDSCNSLPHIHWAGKVMPETTIYVSDMSLAGGDVGRSPPLLFHSDSARAILVFSYWCWNSRHLCRKRYRSQRANARYSKT